MSDNEEPVLVETENDRQNRAGFLGIVIPIIFGAIAYGVAKKLFGELSPEFSSLSFFAGAGLSLLIKAVRDAFIEVVLVLGSLAAIIAFLVWLFSSDSSTSEIPEGADPFVYKQCQDCAHNLSLTSGITREWRQSVLKNCAKYSQQCKSYNLTWKEKLYP